MKLLFVITSLHNGGSEKALSNLSQNFPNNVECTVLINKRYPEDYPFKGRILTLDIKDDFKMSLWYQARVFLKRIKTLRMLKSSGEYQACISFMDSANFANILSGKRYAAVIGSVRSSIEKAGKRSPQYRYIIAPLIRMLYNRADAIVAVSSGVKKELVQKFALKEDKVATIENGCDISLLEQKAGEPMESEDSAWSDKKWIVTVGRLSEAKGQGHLIRAFGEVCKSNVDVMLFILGAGEQETYLKQLAEVCGIQDRVIFKGFVKNPYKYVSKAEMFILPSLYEGYPNALAEAVCLGVPCIAADFHTSAREILAPELENNGEKITEVCQAQYGILFPVCSGKMYKGKEKLETAEMEMAAAMRILLEDTGKREYYARQSLERRNTLSIDAAVQKWMELVE